MKIKVGVFFGGKTVEHEVSIITAIQAIENMNTEKYEIIPVYIAKDNKMYCGEGIGDIKNYKDIDKLIESSTQVTLAQIDNKACLIKCKKSLFGNNIYNNIDVAFPIVHGTNAEDGTIEGYLKMFNIPYAESDVISSAVGMDKYVCKCVLKDKQIPTLECVSFNKHEYETESAELIKEIESKFKFPVIVKPVNCGSSVGITIAKNKDEMLDAIDNAFIYSTKILVEKAITNLKEVNCSVLGDYEQQETSECEEPVKKHDILSFEDKYISGGKKGSKSMNAGVLKLPADISSETKERIQNLAVKTFNALGCSGVIRIDFIIDQDTGDIFVNEVNTIPGSLSFHLWKAKNVPYTELLDRIISLALKRNREEAQTTFSFDSNILAGYTTNGFGGTKGGEKM